MITRRQSLKRLLGVAAATLTVPGINRGWFQLFAESATKYSARAIDLVQRGTLTYTSRNLIGNGSTERRDDGISDFGVTIIDRMNKVRMAVDVAHCGDRTTS